MKMHHRRHHCRHRHHHHHGDALLLLSRSGMFALMVATAMLFCTSTTTAFSAVPPPPNQPSSTATTSTSTTSSATASTATSTTTTPPLKQTGPSRIQRIMDNMVPMSSTTTTTTMTMTTGGAGGGPSTYDAFLRMEENWNRLKASKAFKYDSKLLSNDTNNMMPSSIRFVTDDVGEGSEACWMKLRELATTTTTANRPSSSSTTTTTTMNDGTNTTTKTLQQPKPQPPDYDVVVCGGTLGIFFATALALKGYSVLVVEAGPLQGRQQEWNISYQELLELVHLNILESEEDLMEIITTEFPACRSGFKNKEITPLAGGYFDNDQVGYECFTPNVLNLGIAPTILLQRVSERFLALGGTIRQFTPISSIVISESLGAALEIRKNNNNNNNNNNPSMTNTMMMMEEKDSSEIITAKLVLDCMGNNSPISRQQRFGMKPDGVCAVVGSCASGYDPLTNTVGDIIYTNSELQNKGNAGSYQYFWEAFPVGIGRDSNDDEVMNEKDDNDVVIQDDESNNNDNNKKNDENTADGNDSPRPRRRGLAPPGTSTTKTTYMFTYLDADEERLSMETFMEDYFDLLPIYQPSIQNAETDLTFHRILFAYFPTYRDSPLQPQWSRILAVGDASGIQSPLSFGGFGALTRHLGRISGAISDALEHDTVLLKKEHLSKINAYTPNLSAAWMFQKAMSVRMDQHKKAQQQQQQTNNNDDSGLDTKFVNRLLATNFQVMDKMGLRTIQPFLQDVIRFDGLVASLAGSFVADPLFMPSIVGHVGIPNLVDWLGHVSMMGLYTFLDANVSPIMTEIVDNMKDPRDKFHWKRQMEAWKYGSGRDYVLPPETEE